MEAFIDFITNNIFTISAVIIGAYVIIHLHRRKRRHQARQEAERWLSKARETITNSREAAGLPRLPPSKITINNGDFDEAERYYVTNPTRLLTGQRRLKAELDKALEGSFQCSPNWEITIPGYNGSTALPNCASLYYGVSDQELTTTINALSKGGFNSQELVEGPILELARNLARKAADAKAPRPTYEDNRRYIGAALQDLGNGKLALRRGRNKALADIDEAEKDAQELRTELLDGIFEVGFMADNDTIGTPVQGKLTAIVLCGTLVTKYE